MYETWFGSNDVMESVVNRPDAPVKEAESPKPRIVQYHNRRYSVRLEPVFWRALERLAEQSDVRLGRYIADQAERCPGGNFSSFLRVHCMLNFEERLAEQHLETTHASLMAVVQSAPLPGLILSRYRSIIGANPAFLEWLGPVEVAIRGANLTTLIQVRTRLPLNEVWQKMLDGNLKGADARVLYVAPGRVNAAHANFVPIHVEDGQEFYAIMWLAHTGARSQQAAPETSVARPALPR
jgi:predicted DNA-binding ribbon-helix-helix protein